MPSDFVRTSLALQIFLSEEHYRAQQTRSEMVEIRARTAETIAQSRELMARVDALLA